MRNKRLYPFKIPEFIPPKGIDLDTIHPKLRFEFLRVEALLRSLHVHKLFKMKDKQKALNCLASKYGLRWNILDGAHHHWLGPEAIKGMDSFIRPVEDIGAMITRSAKNGEGRPEIWIKGLLSGVSQANDAYLTLRIDTTYSLKTICEALEPILKEKCEKSKKSYKGSHLSNIRVSYTNNSSDVFAFTPLSYGGPRDPIRKRNPKVETWLQRFHWYDRYYCDKLTYDDIAHETFGVYDEYKSTVSKGVARVRKMIKAAEADKWPPTIS